MKEETNMGGDNWRRNVEEARAWCRLSSHWRGEGGGRRRRRKG